VWSIEVIEVFPLLQFYLLPHRHFSGSPLIQQATKSKTLFADVDVTNKAVLLAGGKTRAGMERLLIDANSTTQPCQIEGDPSRIHIPWLGTSIVSSLSRDLPSQCPLYIKTIFPSYLVIARNIQDNLWVLRIKFWVV
jgi:hypothetical protein